MYEWIWPLTTAILTSCVEEVVFLLYSRLSIYIFLWMNFLVEENDFFLIEATLKGTLCKISIYNSVTNILWKFFAWKCVQKIYCFEERIFQNMFARQQFAINQETTLWIDLNRRRINIFINNLWLIRKFEFSNVKNSFFLSDIKSFKQI